MKIPYQDDSVKGNTRRRYWTRDMAVQARRAMIKETEATLASKGKKWNQADRVKAVNEKWGEYCESQHSIAEGQAMLREYPGIDRQENDFARRKG